MKKLLALVALTVLASPGFSFTDGITESQQQLNDQFGSIMGSFRPAIPESTLAETYDNYDPEQRYPLLVGLGADEVRLQNVRTGFEVGAMQWETFSIKPSMLEKVYLVHRLNNVNHILLHFEFKPGGVTDSKGRQHTGLILSAEPFMHKGDSYEHVLFVSHKLIKVWSTWDDYEAIMKKKRYVLQRYELNITKEQTDKMFIEAVRASLSLDQGYYDIWKNNCTTNPLDIVKKVYNQREKYLFSKIAKYVSRVGRLPYYTVEALKEAGFISREPVETINGEYMSEVGKHPLFKAILAEFTKRPQAASVTLTPEYLSALKAMGYETDCR